MAILSDRLMAPRSIWARWPAGSDGLIHGHDAAPAAGGTGATSAAAASIVPRRAHLIPIFILIVSSDLNPLSLAARGPSGRVCGPIIPRGSPIQSLRHTERYLS